MPVLLGAVADDFTGATDLASILVRSGMRTSLVLGAPGPDTRAPESEAVVVALKSRTAPVAQAVSDSVAAWNWLKAAGARQCCFKYCSTFDSTPEGNIGPVALALMAETGAERTIYCPAMPENGRTIYQGHLFVHDVLLSTSPMRNHPLTPMTEADLRKALSPQIGGAPVGLVPLTQVERGEEAVRAALTDADAPKHLIVDALTEAHLRVIGLAAGEMPLVTGGSGLGVGLAEAMAKQGLLAGGSSDSLPSIGGPVVCLSGSCSAATLGQVAVWRGNGGALLQLDPLLLAKEGTEAAIAFMLDHVARETPCLVAASQPPEDIARVQSELGRERAAELVENALSEIAVAAQAAGARRFVVAGGETSGAVVQALGVSGLGVGPSIAPGVPWCVGDTDPPIALALKSGNFGADTFFADAVGMAP